MAGTLPSLALSYPMSRKSRHSPLSLASTHLPVGSTTVNSTCFLELKGATHRSICLKRVPWQPHCTKRSADLGGPDSRPDPIRPSDAITQFYSLINSKKLDKLRELISEDCYFEELSFPNPFQGRTEVMYFLTELANDMGHNIRFIIEKVYEGGDEFAAGVMWHLEWKEKQIPFTKGCSFYECSKVGEKLVIKKARVVIESPVKPGVFLLKLLSVVSSVFDQFPNLTERFLQKPHIVLKFLLKIYKILVEPMILPVLVYYTHLWKFVARLFGCVFNILLNIFKLFK
ncbi:uncharacterized protein LOC131233303 isoform X2 [Magnolia sinica]|uniref:uncharacterized protein LOC131233303 isoform X2 n=1 Tax=Magnolia sinica TaxID=86752 RepID=UPI0026599782|nr:uncharacterized protein LOC131233303 isoform X2 [Magnolia sinica]